MATRIYAFLTALLLLLGSGVLYYLHAGSSEELTLPRREFLVPVIVGAWHAHDEAADERAFEQTGAIAHWTRRYINQKTKDSVLVILMCGRPGKMAVHTPEVCYSGAGYELHQQPTACPIGGNANFWTAKFMKKDSQLQLFWAWNAAGVWEASTSPRWQYRGQPFLYKLYVSRDISAQTKVAPETDATAAFLREFMPGLKQTLLP